MENDVKTQHDATYLAAGNESDIIFNVNHLVTNEHEDEEDDDDDLEYVD